MTSLNSAGSRIVLPLDGMNSLEEISEVADGLNDLVGPFKLGLEAISEDLAHQAADYIIKVGGTIFWDGKFHDIPNTEGNATAKVIKRHPSGIWAVNVHLTSGRKAIHEAVEKRGSANVLGVTLLTSISDEEAQEIYGSDAATVVLRLAKIGVECGVQGLICSPKEVPLMRSEFGDDLLLVTPGIRPAGADAQDQARVETPRSAILSGADYLVIGRPITQAEDRREAARSIALEIAAAFVLREGREGN